MEFHWLHIWEPLHLEMEETCSVGEAAQSLRPFLYFSVIHMTNPYSSVKVSVCLLTLWLKLKPQQSF